MQNNTSFQFEHIYSRNYYIIQSGACYSREKFIAYFDVFDRRALSNFSMITKEVSMKLLTQHDVLQFDIINLPAVNDFKLHIRV
jgi:hypothetical protein